MNKINKLKIWIKMNILFIIGCIICISVVYLFATRFLDKYSNINYDNPNKEDGFLTLHFNITEQDQNFEWYNKTKTITIKYQIGHYETLALCRYPPDYMVCKELFAGCGAVNCECWSR